MLAFVFFLFDDGHGRTFCNPLRARGRACARTLPLCCFAPPHDVALSALRAKRWDSTRAAPHTGGPITTALAKEEIRRDDEGRETGREPLKT